MLSASIHRRRLQTGVLAGKDLASPGTSPNSPVLEMNLKILYNVREQLNLNL